MHQDNCNAIRPQVVGERTTRRARTIRILKKTKTPLGERGHWRDVTMRTWMQPDCSLDCDELALDKPLASN